MFAQESVMDIKKVNHLLEQFEKTKTFKRFFSTLLRFDEDLDCFVATEKWRDKEAELLTAAWWMFAEVATAQPVPEGFEQAYSEIFSPIIKQPYPRLENGDYKYIETDQGWKLWQTAAAQAVPEGFVVVSQKDLLELTIAINAVDLATHTESKTNEVREMWQQVALKLMALGISQEPAND